MSNQFMNEYIHIYIGYGFVIFFSVVEFFCHVNPLLPSTTFLHFHFLKQPTANNYLLFLLLLFMFLLMIIDIDSVVVIVVIAVVVVSRI
jgi:hypothetical protein